MGQQEIKELKDQEDLVVSEEHQDLRENPEQLESQVLQVHKEPLEYQEELERPELLDQLDLQD